jgi:hypothetical protein
MREVNLLQQVLMFAVRLYRWTLSPAKVFLFGPGCGCRFEPSCSAYALEALRVHGALAGSWLAARRVCRCHPWGACGHDPVPDKESKARSPRSNPARGGMNPADSAVGGTVAVFRVPHSALGR